MSAPTTWTRGEAERAAKALFGNQALHRAAAAMAGSHPRALDYIRQAPVIVLAANAGRTGPVAAQSALRYAGPPMRMLAERGAKLREVMTFYDCAYHLRQLVPSVLHPVRWDVIRHLGALPPSTLAQIIPPVRSQQDVWLRTLTRWSDHCARRTENPWFRFDWAARALRGIERGQERTVDTIADLLIEAGQATPRGGAAFDPRWNLGHAQAALDRWHRALSQVHAEKTAAAELGVGFSERIDYVPFPNAPSTVAAYTFVPLRSCEDLWVDGVQMHHCVGTYGRDVMTGRARLYSIQKDGRRIATVEYVGGSTSGPEPHGIGQVKGPCNARPSRAVLEAASDFLTGVRASIARGGPLRSAFPGVGARFSDEDGPPARALSSGPGA